MAPQVSLELHECIIAWHHKLNMSINDIIHLSNRFDKTVCNMLKTYQDHNEFMQPFTQPRGRKRLLDRDDLNYLEAILHAEPGLFLDELQEKLCTVQDIEVSISTLSHALPSHTNLSQRKQLNGTKIFMPLGRLPWHNMTLSSLYLLMKLV